MDYIIKINFAGSGDFVWRKVVHSNTIELDEDLAKQSSDDKRKELAEQLEDLVPRDQSILFRFEGEEILAILPNTLRSMYGEGQINVKRGNILTFWFKQDISKLKTTYTVPGVQGKLFGMVGHGAADIGQYSIRKTVETLISEIIKKIDTLSTSLDDNDHVIVRVKGHSRGGVSANFVIKQLSQKYKSNPNIRIKTVLFDPVPGPSILSERSGNLKSNEYDEISLDEMISSAVVYSLKSNKTGMQEQFNIQKVLKSRVIIIMDEDHAVGLYDTSVKEDGNKTVKRLYSISIPGKENCEYSPGKLMDLPDGIYWADNNQQKKRFELTKLNKRNVQRYVSIIAKSNVEFRRNFLLRLIYEKFVDKCFITNDVSKTLDILQMIYKGKKDDDFLEVLNDIAKYVKKDDKKKELLFFDKLREKPSIKDDELKVKTICKLEEMII